LDAASLVGHLVPEGSVFAFLAMHRGEVFPDAMFGDLFGSATGRPSVPVDVMASVLVLQALHDTSDRDTVEAVRCDLRWKVACGLPLDDAVPPVDVDVLAAPVGRFGRAEPDLRRGPGGDRRDRGAQG
jgi:hypothetical protein